MRVAIGIAFCLLAASAKAEPVTLEQVSSFYEARAAAGQSPRKPHLHFGAAMKTGHVGVVPYSSPEGERTPFYATQVLQVLGETEMLLSVTIYEWREAFSGEGAYARPLGLQPKQTADTTVLLRHVSTEGLVDEKPIGLPGAWKVAGTHAYLSAAGGTRTVFVLEPTDLPDPPERKEPPKPAPAPVEKEPAEKEPVKTPEPAMPKEPTLRTWTDASGAFSVEAEFRGVIGGKVRLRTKDGRDLAVPLDRLSDGDRRWIRERR